MFITTSIGIRARSLKKVKHLTGSDQMYIGNSQGLSINSIGSMSFSSPFSPNTTLRLNNLLHVPSITKNLVSVCQFCKDYSLSFILTLVMLNLRVLLGFF